MRQARQGVRGVGGGWVQWKPPTKTANPHLALAPPPFPANHPPPRFLTITRTSLPCSGRDKERNKARQQSTHWLGGGGGGGGAPLEAPTALLAPTPSPTHEPSSPKQWAPSSITYSAEQVCGGGWQPCCWVGTRGWEGSRRDAEHRNNNHIDWHPTPMKTHAQAKAQAPPNAKAQGPKPLPEFMRKQTGTHI